MKKFEELKKERSNQIIKNCLESAMTYAYLDALQIQIKKIKIQAKNEWLHSPAGTWSILTQQ